MRQIRIQNNACVLPIVINVRLTRQHVQACVLLPITCNQFIAPNPSGDFEHAQTERILSI